MMRIKDSSYEDIRTLYNAAREAGIDFDHADLYGGQRHTCERRFASALKLSTTEREQITLQTKTGIVAEEWHYDSSYDHIVTSAEESLEALSTDYIAGLSSNMAGEEDSITCDGGGIVNYARINNITL